MKKKKLTSEHMIDSLMRQGLSMAYMERVLDLPPRTMMRWKNGKISWAAKILLKLIYIYPWMLLVAENGYKPLETKYIVANAGLQQAYLMAKKEQEKLLKRESKDK